MSRDNVVVLPVIRIERHVENSKDNALRAALMALRLASKHPQMGKEMNFQPVIDQVVDALKSN